MEPGNVLNDQMTLRGSPAQCAGAARSKGLNGILHGALSAPSEGPGSMLACSQERPSAPSEVRAGGGPGRCFLRVEAWQIAAVVVGDGGKQLYVPFQAAGECLSACATQHGYLAHDVADQGEPCRCGIGVRGSRPAATPHPQGLELRAGLLQRADVLAETVDLAFEPPDLPVHRYRARMVSAFIA